MLIAIVHSFPSPNAALPEVDVFSKGVSSVFFLLPAPPGHILKPPGFQLAAAAAENVTIDVRVDPNDPDIGWDVALSPSGMKTNILACHWYRGETNNFLEILAYDPKRNSVTYGPASRHRERIRPDCTLLIRDVLVTDSDFYAVYKNSANRSEVGTATLIVRGNCYYRFRLTCSNITRMVLKCNPGV